MEANNEVTRIILVFVFTFAFTVSCYSKDEDPIYSGVYSEGMEHMAFSPRGKEVNWWVNHSPLALQFLINRPTEDDHGEISAVVRGDLSQEGEYGHMGAYPRELSISRVIARRIPIPEREHGYRSFQSTVISSPDELRTFLTKIDAGKSGGWNDPSAFREAIKRAVLDFGHENLVFVRQTESSGSIRVHPELRWGKNGNLHLTIERDVPTGGTADMAYYAFAFAVDVRRVRKMVKVVDDRVQDTFDVKQVNQGRLQEQSPLEIRWKDAKRLIRSRDIDSVVLHEDTNEVFLTLSSGMRYRTTGEREVKNRLQQHLKDKNWRINTK